MKSRRFSFSRLLVLAFAGTMLFALLLVFRAESLVDIDGRGSSGAAPPDLLEEVGAAIDRGQAFECSEAALNDYISSNLSAREGSAFDLIAEFRGLWIRLEDGYFELVLEREFLGLITTVSARFEIRRTPKGYSIGALGGRFGRLPVPSGMLNLIRPALENIGRVFGPEKEVLSRSRGLTLADGWLRLEP